MDWNKLQLENDIKYISIYGYTNYQKKILILIGKEFNNKPNKTDIGLFSEFFGKIENEESIPESTSRILFEKSMNMIIDQDEFKQEIINNKIKYKIIKNRLIFFYNIDYDTYKNLPIYYNRVFKYINLCQFPTSYNNWAIESCPFNFFDKSELKWVDFTYIQNNISLFKKQFIQHLL